MWLSGSGVFYSYSIYNNNNHIVWLAESTDIIMNEDIVSGEYFLKIKT